MSSQELQYSLEMEAVESSYTPFLHHLDSPLDVRDMLILCGHIYQWYNWQGLYQALQRPGLAVCMHCGDAEATMQVILLYLLEGFEYLQHCAICWMIDCREVYLSTQRQEEWDFIHEKDVACEEDFLVQLNKSYRDIQLIPGHYIWIFPSGLAFNY